MPFASVTDPVDLARARDALEAAWQQLKIESLTDGDERDRTRLAYIVASFLPAAEDKEHLVRRVIAKFRVQGAVLVR